MVFVAFNYVLKKINKHDINYKKCKCIELDMYIRNTIPFDIYRKDFNFRNLIIVIKIIPRKNDLTNRSQSMLNIL